MLLPPSFGAVLHDSVPETATFVAPLDGDGDDGVVGAGVSFVVKFHVVLCADFPLPLYTMTFQ